LPPSNAGHAAGMTLPAELAYLAPLREFVRNCLEAAGMDPVRTIQSDLVLEEVFLNIVTHAYAPEQSGTITVECGMREADGLFWVRFTDQGRPFDPLSAPDPDINLAMEDRHEGGLGILLTKKISAAQQYCRKDGQNILDVFFTGE